MTVWAHVGQLFTETEYDFLIVGAGRMGTATAFYLRQLYPEARLLLTEEGGLPNEEGATILAPGLWTTLDLPEKHQADAAWTRRQLLGEAVGTVPAIGTPQHWQLEARPVVKLCHEALSPQRPDLRPTQDLPATLQTLFDEAAWPTFQQDADALTYRPGSLALHLAQEAIRAGADLMLNVRVRLRDGGAELHRLTVTNTHRIVVHSVQQVRARAVVVAAGANGPHMVEEDLGLHTRHGRAFQQYPRLERSSTAQTPVLRAGGLTLRPQNGGFTLLPALHHRDPHGYQPTGGSLTGVPTGLRREVLEDLVGLMDTLPALAGAELHLGRSAADIPGAWVALPQGRPETPPQHEALAPGLSLLLGGPLADTLGLATAYALASELGG